MTRHLLLALALCAPGLAQAQPRVEVFAGMALVDQTVTVGGVKLIDQGGDAIQAGLRVGYDFLPNPTLRFGVEAEGFGAWGRSRAVVNGAVYSLDLHGGVGGFARLGFTPDGGRAMFFARAGVQAWSTSDGWRTAPAVGVGAEVALADQWFARLDTLYANASGLELYQGTVAFGRRF